jgi:hypothetical protein
MEVISQSTTEKDVGLTTKNTTFGWKRCVCSKFIPDYVEFRNCKHCRLLKKDEILTKKKTSFNKKRCVCKMLIPDYVKFEDCKYCNFKNRICSLEMLMKDNDNTDKDRFKYCRHLYSGTKEKNIAVCLNCQILLERSGPCGKLSFGHNATTCVDCDLVRFPYVYCENHVKYGCTNKVRKNITKCVNCVKYEIARVAMANVNKNLIAKYGEVSENYLVKIEFFSAKIKNESTTFLKLYFPVFSSLFKSGDKISECYLFFGKGIPSKKMYPNFQMYRQNPLNYEFNIMPKKRKEYCRKCNFGEFPVVYFKENIDPDFVPDSRIISELNDNVMMFYLNQLNMTKYFQRKFYYVKSIRIAHVSELDEDSVISDYDSIYPI